MLKIKILFLLVAIGAIAYSVKHSGHQNIVTTASQAAESVAATVQKATEPSPCAANSLAKVVIVSVSKRHMWACETTNQAYDSPVITGMEFLPADLTPRGSYTIYGKQTNQTLKGSDSTGSWNDFVNYWMPFLENQYGTYGFHDATWRADSDFGNIDPNSKQASHGCVEMPLATMKWLYNWATVGTSVTITD